MLVEFSGVGAHSRTYLPTVAMRSLSGPNVNGVVVGAGTKHLLTLKLHLTLKLKLLHLHVVVELLLLKLQ